MHNKQLLMLLLLLAAAAAARSDVEVEAEDASALTVSTFAPDEQQQTRNLVKRAPGSSFIGMRGKKEQEAAADANWLGPDPLDYGEDDVDNYYNENGQRLKKAPLAFIGMRGKKFNADGNRLRDLMRQMEQERLRENFVQALLDQLVMDNTDVAKRAPTGFTGMRGKRPAMAVDNGGEDESDAMELHEKRAPVSFVGVRGKKDVSHQHYKRAALSEAYDVRGKKQRYADLNTKFVALRGKKSDLVDDIGVKQNVVQPWLYLIGGKRAPIGFVGMRGKRPALEE